MTSVLREAPHTNVHSCNLLALEKRVDECVMWMSVSLYGCALFKDKLRHVNNFKSLVEKLI